MYELILLRELGQIVFSWRMWATSRNVVSFGGEHFCSGTSFELPSP